MAKWAYVEGSTVVEVYDAIPLSWRHISGLNHSESDIDFLKSIGWLPVVKSYQTYDSSVLREDGYTYSVDGDQVNESLNLIAKDPEPSFKIKKDLFLTQLRGKRDRLLTESDWSQLQDVQISLSDEIKYKWVIYRQALRDLPQAYSTNDVVDITQVNWPVL